MLECNLYPYFWCNAVLISSEKNADVSRIQKVCHVIYIFFGSSLGKYNCTKFHHCRIGMTNFKKGRSLWPATIRKQPWISSLHFFHEIFSYKINKCRESKFHYQISIFFLMHILYMILPINFCYHLKNFPLRHQSMNYLSQNIRNVFNKFHSFIAFFSRAN